VCFRSLRWVAVAADDRLRRSLYWVARLWALTAGQLTMVGSVISSLVTGDWRVNGMSLRHALPHRPAGARSRTALAGNLAGHRATGLLGAAGLASGFAALLVCELKPVLDFAWLMLLAVLLLGVAMMLFLPFGILGRRPAPARDLPGQDRLAGCSTPRWAWVRRRPWTVAAVSGGAGGGGWGWGALAAVASADRLHRQLPPGYTALPAYNLH